MKYTIDNESYETSAKIIKSDQYHVFFQNDVMYSGSLGDCFEYVQTLPCKAIERKKSEIETLWNFDWDELEEVLA